MNSSIDWHTAPAASSLVESIELGIVTGLLKSCGTIPNPHKQASQLSSQQLWVIQYNQGYLYCPARCESPQTTSAMHA